MLRFHGFSSFFSMRCGLLRDREKHCFGGVVRVVEKSVSVVSVSSKKSGSLYFVLGSGSSLLLSGLWEYFPGGRWTNFYICSDLKVHSYICTTHRRPHSCRGSWWPRTSRAPDGIVRSGCNWTSTLLFFFLSVCNTPIQRQVAGCHVCWDWTA